MTTTATDVLDRLQRIFRDALDKDSLRITAETTQLQIPEWDSMAQVTLIMMIESEFGLRLTGREASELTSIKSILNLFERKTKES